MNNSNRDLLVLFNHDLMTPRAIEHEVEQLHELLYEVESLDNVIIAHELIDVNKYKIVTGNMLRINFNRRQLPSFVFINCKN
jgi:hypothetical protein